MPLSKPALLLSRLTEIGSSLAQSGQAIALIGLGSVGLGLDRLDAYSDLDFFAVVETGRKNGFLDDLAWLSAICPIAYAFRNTPDGYKLLYEDGVFCEFAVFEEPELRRIPFSPGRIVWKREEVSDSIAAPVFLSPRMHSVEWALGEALTNLYVGLGRYQRGEKLSAMRFIQSYAVDRVLELCETLEPDALAARDVFALERRYEQRHPAVARELSEFAQGYDRSIESAQAILAFLDSHFEVNSAIKQAILTLCAPGNCPARIAGE